MHWKFLMRELACEFFITAILEKKLFFQFVTFFQFSHKYRLQKHEIKMITSLIDDCNKLLVELTNAFFYLPRKQSKSFRFIRWSDVNNQLFYSTNVKILSYRDKMCLSVGCNYLVEVCWFVKKIFKNKFFKKNFFFCGHDKKRLLNCKNWTICGSLQQKLHFF